MRVLYGHVSFLLAGDAEQEAEHGMVSRYGNFLESTLLKVGHHGSGTSSTDEFVNSVQPKYAVISVGRWNRFGHPSKSVLQRFADQGVDLSRTDEEGAVLFETDGFMLEHLAWR
jgi:competence protein ComEC